MKDYRVAYGLNLKRSHCVAELTTDRGLVPVLEDLRDWQAYAIVAILDPPFDGDEYKEPAP